MTHSFPTRLSSAPATAIGPRESCLQAALLGKIGHPRLPVLRTAEVDACPAPCSLKDRCGGFRLTQRGDPVHLVCLIRCCSEETGRRPVNGSSTELFQIGRAHV